MVARKSPKKLKTKKKRRTTKSDSDSMRLIKWLFGSKPGRKPYSSRPARNRSSDPSRLIKNLLYGWIIHLAKRHRVLRFLLVIGTIATFLIWSGINSLPPPSPKESSPAQFYASQCNDDLRKVFVSSIKEAEKSILLIIYSLTDDQVIKALQEKASQGVAITVIHDASTASYGIKRLSPEIKRIGWKKSGLMHQKILVVDESKVWIGTANLTTESLRIHDNIVIGMCSGELARAITKRQHRDFFLGGQLVEFWILPEEKKDGLNQLLSLVRKAERSIKVAMFTWTHPDLTRAIIEAHNRGVKVEVVIDHGQGLGVSEKSVDELSRAGVNVALSRSEMLHHKLAYIDDQLLVVGSANWTRAAFSKNEECFLVIHDLNEEQKNKMNSLWHAIRATRELINNDRFKIVEQLKEAA